MYPENVPHLLGLSTSPDNRWVVLSLQFRAVPQGPRDLLESPGLGDDEVRMGEVTTVHPHPVVFYLTGT
jgi:hypothetical protein